MYIHSKKRWEGFTPTFPDGENTDHFTTLILLIFSKFLPWACVTFISQHSEDVTSILWLCLFGGTNIKTHLGNPEI